MTPAELKEHYKSQGYSIIAYTDHELIVDHSDLADEDFLPITGVEYAVLELEPVDGELCSGCPFTAVEQKRFEAGELRDESAAERISLSYRPARLAESYRWRLVGHNTISGLPDVDSDVATVENGEIALSRYLNYVAILEADDMKLADWELR